MEKLTGKELQKALSYSVEHIAKVDASMTEKSFAFCEPYKEFLTKSKTERLAAQSILKIAKENGYVEFVPGKEYKAGDKVYVDNRGRAVILSTIGQKTVDNGVSVVASHIDSPRLDVKPNPLYESSEIAYFKTHYFGGVKRYQWATLPLAIHGVVIKTTGEKVEIHIGEDPSDPVFCLTDLLPHLAKDQRERKMADVIRGEEMNIVLASLPYQGEDLKDAVKLTALVYLYEKYGITERELLNAELELVPAGGARDVGFDRSLIGSYGHDDRVCAYPAEQAIFSIENPDYTAITVLTDKEETGSDGNTGLQSSYLVYFINDLAKANGIDGYRVLSKSECLSADVNSAYDPTFNSVFEKNNTSYLNKGVVITKYTGARGKSGTSDASAEYMGKIRNMLDKAGVVWQIGELGKVDAGGGGTVAKYIANLDVDVVDLGVPVLSMHAPYEVISKLDLYMAYRAFTEFFKQ